MVHVALFFLGADGVDHLVHAGHPECCHVEHLGLPPLEQPRAVSGREYAHTGTERPAGHECPGRQYVRPPRRSACAPAFW